jgi:hypothetical protein
MYKAPTKFSNHYKETYAEQILEIARIKKKYKVCDFLDLPVDEPIMVWFDSLTQIQLEILAMDSFNLRQSEIFSSIMQTIYRKIF